MRTPAIDETMLQTEIWDDGTGDATEHDRARAHRVVAYIRRRFPAVRYDDAPHDVEHEADRAPATGEAAR